MCLLIVKPEGVELPFESILHGMENNPHGVGIATPKHGVISIWRSLTKDPKEVFQRLDKAAPAIVHMRWATHGAIAIENTHPFHLRGGKIGAAHNGVISMKDCPPKYSDTRWFLKTRCEPIFGMGGDVNDIFTQHRLEIGSSKLAFMEPTGDVMVINMELGETVEGVWYSNSGYKEDKWDWTYLNSHWFSSKRGKGRDRFNDDDDDWMTTGVSSSPYEPIAPSSYWEEGYEIHNSNNIVCDWCRTPGVKKFAVVDGCIVCGTCLLGNKK